MYPGVNAICQVTVRFDKPCDFHPNQARARGKGGRTITVRRLGYCCASAGLLLMRRALRLCV